MVSTEEFAFTIGYDGPAAVVDALAHKQFGGLSVSDLAEKGYFRPAFAKALFSDDAAGVQLVMDRYNKLAGTAYTKPDQLSRLFGVFKEKPARSKKL
jgi:hypothetical protein